jgi:hypothetical protein
LEKDTIVLADEVAQAIEDGPAFVDLNASVFMGPMTYEHISPGVYDGMSKDSDMVGGICDGLSAFVGVNGEQNPVSHSFGIADPLNITL